MESPTTTTATTSLSQLNHETITRCHSTDPTSKELFTNMMYPHHSKVISNLNDYNNIMVPGLVSPTDSQKTIHNHLMALPSTTSHDRAILLAQQTIKTFSSSKQRKQQMIIQPRTTPMPLMPRPTTESILVPNMPNFSTPTLSTDDDNAGTSTTSSSPNEGGQQSLPVQRLNKFVRRLHDMLQTEKDSGIVEWRRGLLVLFSTDAFSKQILPKYFNTKNFKTFRRQLNYYGFVHVRSFSATGNSTTALWINQSLAEDEANDDVSAVLKLRRVEPCETAKTVEGRRQRKELALHTVEEDIGLDAKKLQLDQIRSMAIRGEEFGCVGTGCGAGTFILPSTIPAALEVPREVRILSSPPSDSSVHSSTSSNYAVGHNDDDCEMTTMEYTARGANTNNNTSSTPLGESNAAAANMLLMLARS